MIENATTIYIYGLEDPDTGGILYVGQTVDPTKRLKQHLSAPPPSIGERIRALKAQGKTPIMRTLATTVDRREAARYEAQYIAQHRTGGSGGRAGAGRVPLPATQRKVQVTITVHPRTAPWLDAQGISVGQAIDRLVAEKMGRDDPTEY